MFSRAVNIGRREAGTQCADKIVVRILGKVTVPVSQIDNKSWKKGQRCSRTSFYKKQIGITIPVYVTKGKRAHSGTYVMLQETGMVKKGVVWKVPSPFPA